MGKKKVNEEDEEIDITVADGVTDNVEEAVESAKKAVKKSKKTKAETTKTSGGLADVLSILKSSGISIEEKREDDFISTGHAGLNYMLSGQFCGPRAGLTLRRLIEVYGPSGSMKSVLMYNAIREIQKIGGIAAIVDAEQAHDDRFLDIIGVDRDRCFFLAPKTKSGEVCFTVESSFSALIEFVTKMRQNGIQDPIFCGLDSVAVLPLQEEWEQARGTDGIKEDQGRRAKKIGVFMRNINNVVKASNTTFMIINQLRATIPKPGQWGAPAETTTSGQAIQYLVDTRVEMRRGKTINISSGADKNERSIGRIFKVNCKKGRITAPDKKVELSFFYAHGMAPLSGLFDLMLAEHFIVKVNQSRYSAVDIKSRDETQLKVLSSLGTFTRKDFEDGTWLFDHCEIFGIDRAALEDMVKSSQKAHDFWINMREKDAQRFIMIEEDEDDEAPETPSSQLAEDYDACD